MAADRSEIIRRVRWLLVGRLAAALLTAGLLLLLGGRRGAYVVPVAAIALDAVYFAVLGRVRDLRRFAAVQVVVDGLLETALVALTGGVVSFATILYFASILAGCLIVSPRFGIGFASGATAAVAAVGTLIALAVADVGARLPSPVFLPDPPIGAVAAYAIVHGLAFHLVAVLAGRLHAEFARVRILYDEILERMAEGLVAVDAGGRIIVVNGEARRLLAYRGDEGLAGLSLRDVFRRREDKAILGCLESLEPMRIEVEVAMREGSRKDVEVKTTILRDERGGVRGVIGIFTDLEPRRQAEAAERRAERLEGIEQLAFGIAHEIRNPLASIRGCVQELGRLGGVGEEGRELAEIVCRESDRLDGIIGEFLRFARMRPPILADVDLTALVEETAVLLRGRADGAAVLLVLTDLPKEAHLRADREALTQVFLNLGINALESFPRRGGRLAIRCAPAHRIQRRPDPAGGGAAAGPDRRRVLSDVPGFEVSFADDGPGIAPEDLERIFSPFFTTKKGGTGLGLAVADRIVKAHGGSIAVESTRGEGTTFRVWLPCEPTVVGVVAPPVVPAPAAG